MQMRAQLEAAEALSAAHSIAILAADAGSQTHEPLSQLVTHAASQTDEPVSQQPAPLVVLSCGVQAQPATACSFTCTDGLLCQPSTACASTCTETLPCQLTTACASTCTDAPHHAAASCQTSPCASVASKPGLPQERLDAGNSSGSMTGGRVHTSETEFQLQQLQSMRASLQTGSGFGELENQHSGSLRGSQQAGQQGLPHPVPTTKAVLGDATNVVAGGHREWHASVTQLKASLELLVPPLVLSNEPHAPQPFYLPPQQQPLQSPLQQPLQLLPQQPFHPPLQEAFHLAPQQPALLQPLHTSAPGAHQKEDEEDEVLQGSVTTSK